VPADTLRAEADAQPAELSGVGPIHPETARRIACDAVRTVVTVAPPADGWVSAAGSTRALPLSVGRATRTIPAHLRTALHLRDQGCRFPGCDRPPAWTDGTTSSTGQTAVPPSSRTWSPCAGRTTARCMSSGGASTSLTDVPWWSHRPDEGVTRSGSAGRARSMTSDAQFAGWLQKRSQPGNV
jgi:hypothetical protein